MKVSQYAQEESLFFSVCAEDGSGKSLALKAYGENNAEVFVLSCSEYWNKKMFLSELLRVMGKMSEGMTVGEMMEDAIRELKGMDYPLLVLDEADKLSDQVLYFFITLYNRLEDHCGIVLMATSYLQKRIEKGYRTNRKGYRELYSRVGRKFVTLGATTDNDVAEVCKANGIDDKGLIKKIAQDSEGDLRRVRRMVFGARKRMAEQEDGE
ncbi:MAG: ATP-binding protein, partial [Bacteroidales bacterium]|nr:ATP-binding protein [Bacteroidales bacterium]